MTQLIHSLAYNRALDLITDPTREPTFTINEVQLWVYHELRTKHPTFNLVGKVMHWDYVRTHLEIQNDLWLFPLSAYYWSQDRVQDTIDGMNLKTIYNKSLAGLCGGPTYGYCAVTSRADLKLVLTKLVRGKITINGSAASLDENADCANTHLPVRPPDLTVIKRGLSTLRIQNGHPKRIRI